MAAILQGSVMERFLCWSLAAFKPNQLTRALGCRVLVSVSLSSQTRYTRPFGNIHLQRDIRDRSEYSIPVFIQFTLIDSNPSRLHIRCVRRCFGPTPLAVTQSSRKFYQSTPANALLNCTVRVRLKFPQAPPFAPPTLFNPIATTLPPPTSQTRA